MREMLGRSRYSDNPMVRRGRTSYPNALPKRAPINARTRASHASRLTWRTKLWRLFQAIRVWSYERDRWFESGSLQRGVSTEPGSERSRWHGGWLATLDGERHIWWNFASSSKDRIEHKEDWKEGRFPKVPGDEAEFIPLPE